MNTFDYTVSESCFDTRLVGSTSARSHYEVAFPSPCLSHDKEGNTVYGEYFTPKNSLSPLMIISHGYGDGSIAPCLTLARYMVRNGVAAFVPYLPIHSRRLPVHLHGNSVSHDTHTWFEYNRKAIIETRRIIDWASTRPEINLNKIAVSGISFGGMISAISMAVDKRIWAGIFITIGGNLEEMGWGGTSGASPVGHNCTREECREVYAKYPEYVKNVRDKGYDNVIPARECFLIDPVTYADDLRGRPILMINGRDDEFVSRKSTLELWEACDKPRLFWLEGSHAGAYTQSAAISTEIINFLNSIKD